MKVEYKSTKINKRIFNNLDKKYFSKISKKELSHLTLSLIVTSGIYDIDGFLTDILKIIKEDKT